MKQFYLIIIAVTLIFACKNDSSKNVASEIETSALTTAQKIANAHGFENWKNVSEISFTFNVDRDTTHYERQWKWQPKSNDVRMIAGTDTIAFNRNNLDSISTVHDRAFINDKYWLLVPFQLVWDSKAEISEPLKAQAPVSDNTLNKVTITYTQKGGYTPGDAYDIFFDDNYIIQEWIYRSQNAAEPSLINTFENYTTINGLKFAQDHKQKDVNWNLNFTNIEVKN